MVSRRISCRFSHPANAFESIVLTVLFALGNFYMIFRAIYDIGREDAKREVIEITPLDIPDFIQADTLTDSKIREMEEFFNQFNKEDNE